MPTLGGATNRAFPTLTGPVIHEQAKAAPSGIDVITIKVPEGNDLMADGVTTTITTNISMKVALIVVDIPVNCTGILSLDGREIHRSTDGQGSSGHIPLGDLAAGLGSAVTKVEAQLTNDAGASRNIRYWLQGFA